MFLNNVPFGTSMGLAPIDLSSVAKNSNWANFRDVSDTIDVIIQLSAGAGNPVVSLEQASDRLGTNAKALNIQRFHYKKGNPDFATGTGLLDLLSEGAANKENQLASLDLTSLKGGANEFLLLLRIRPQDLDINSANKYNWFRVKFTAVACLGSVLFLPQQMRSGMTQSGVLAV